MGRIQYLDGIQRRDLLRKVLLFLMICLTSIGIFSQESTGMEYKNLNVNFNTYDAKLSNSEKVTPVYTELKYSFNKHSRVSPFIKGDFGFNYIAESEESQGMRDMASNNYSSMGMGVDVGHLSVEAAYTNYQISAEEREDEFSENRVMLKLKYRY